MSYGSSETSIDSGSPFELYEVAYSGKTWYFTSSAKEIVHDSKVYVPSPCSHGEIEQQIGGDKFSLSVTFPHDVEFADIFRVQPPSEIVSLTIKAGHTSAPGEIVVLWKGRIVAPNWQYPTVEFVTENIGSSMRRMGLRRPYSVTCPHALYGPRCGVAREIHKTQDDVSVISGKTITLVGAIGVPNNYFAGGIATWTNYANSNPERRMILSSVGATGELVLNAVPIGLVLGQSVAAYPGCDRSISTCSSKFNNVLNFGGMPYIPTINPFTATMY